MNWISVDKRLPPMDYESAETGIGMSNTVLISDINSHPSLGVGHVSNDGTWTVYMGEHDFMNPATVTHWMPLPAPPTGEPQ